MAKNRITEWQHIHLEGNILSWDIIELVSKENAPATDAASYSLPSGVSVMDAAGQAYSNACAYYKDYQDKIKGKDGQDARDITRDFISRILTYCFSWSLDTVTKLDVGSNSYPIRRMAYGRIPVLTIAGDSSFDKADKLYPITNGQRVISPFNMLQQYLSASGETRWGILASGEKLRLMRSATALSRPEFLEFDLGAILSGDFYNEFVLLYRILHSYRVRDVETGTDLDIWEEWRNTSISDGERVRDRLRDGVQSAIIAFGNGFIRTNKSLSDDITNGRISATDYYHELLRLCYRLLFLSVLEERYSPDGMRMIFAPDSTPEARESYEKGYSLFATGGTHQFLTDNGIPAVKVYWPSESDHEPQALEMLHNKQIDLVVNIPKNLTQKELDNGYKIRRAAIDFNIPLITNARLASAFIEAFCSLNIDDIQIKSWDEYK